MNFFIVVVLLNLSFVVGLVFSQGTTKLMLDAMMQHHGVGEEYDAETWQEILNCMNSEFNDGLDIQRSSDGGWDGFLQYSDTNGQPDGSDPWRQGGWIEWNPTPLGTDNDTIPGATTITINEPCNFASNAIYCRTAVAMCSHTSRGGWKMSSASVTGLVRSYISLCMGSAFFHASGTSLGGAVDNMPIGHLALISHQASMNAIPYQPIIHDLSDYPRSKTGNEFAQEMTHLFINESVYIWEDRINAMDVPNYYNTFASTVVAELNLCFPPELASQLSAFLIPLFLGPDEVEFVLKKFEPAIQQAFADLDVDPPIPVAVDLFQRGLGTLVKMLYAFVWQEQLIPGPWLYDPDDNIRGAEVMPDINEIGNSISGYNHTDSDIQNCIETYPGDYKCRRQEPHSKWHEQAGNALIDLMWLTDDMDRVISEVPLPRRNSQTAFPINSCMSKNECFANIDWSTISWPSWIYNSLVTCLPTFWGKWPGLDYSGFTACSLPNLVGEMSKLPNDLTKNTLEGCLVQNDCLVGGSYFGVDIDILHNCVTNQCADKVDSNLLTCTSTCEDLGCFANCMSKHAKLTPTLQSLSSCYPLLNPAADVSGFVSCLKTFGPFPEFDILFEGFRSPVAAIGSCVETPCKDVAGQVAKATLEIKECVEWCMDIPNSTFKPLPWFTLPRELGCLGECYFNTKSFQEIRTNLSNN